MIGVEHVLAVQINRPGAHPVMTGRSGAVGLLIVTVGVVLVSYGTFSWVTLCTWRARATRVHAVVIENVPQHLRKAGGWVPLVEFDVNSATILSLVVGAINEEGWPLGQPIEVLYDPSNPHRTRLMSAPHLLPSSIIVGVAIIGIYLALVV